MKKVVLKNFANLTVPFLTKLQVFKNKYFEEHLRTTASEKINICSIVQVRRIKLLNSSANKKKKACAKI